jgi:hypothetical protein
VLHRAVTELIGSQPAACTCGHLAFPLGSDVSSCT